MLEFNRIFIDCVKMFLQAELRTTNQYIEASKQMTMTEIIEQAHLLDNDIIIRATHKNSYAEMARGFCDYFLGARLIKPDWLPEDY